MKSQLDSNNTNTVLNNIEERLLKENDRNECDAIEAAARYAAGYHAGVLDTVKAVKAKAAEQQAQNAPEPRTNLDMIRGMSAEKMALWLSSRNIDCEECPAEKLCRANKGIVCEKIFMMWLNSLAKEDGND